MKKLLYVVLGIIVLLALAVVVGPSLIDWRPRIAAMAREATGRELRIDGDLRISLVPKIEVTATGVHFANAPGAPEPAMLALDSLTLDLELLPLLDKRLVVDRLTVKRPIINLNVDKSGRPNWQFASRSAGAPAAPSPSPSSGSGLADGLTLGNVAVENGEITYRNAATGQIIAIKSVAFNAAMAAVESPLTLKGEMNVNNESVMADLVVDNLGKLSRAQQASVKLALETKHLQAKFDGSAQQQPPPPSGSLCC
jgi:AsmA protein